jgi:hypothetical protein
MSAITIVPLRLAVLDLLKATCVVLTVDDEERPPWGAAGWIDWRLNGEISEKILANFITGKPREAVMLSSGRRLSANAIIVLSRAGVPYDTLESMSEFMRKMLKTAHEAGGALPAIAPPLPARKLEETFFTAIVEALSGPGAPAGCEVLLPEALAAAFSGFLQTKNDLFSVCNLSLADARLYPSDAR